MNLILAFLPIVLSQVAGAPAPPNVQARLLAAHESIAPGGQTELAVEISVPAPWHMYHPVILDTGMPTRVTLIAPAGVEIGDLRWPEPHFGKTVGLEYLEFSGTFVAIAPLELAEDFAAESVDISAEVKGLACIELCVPVTTGAQLSLPVRSGLAKPANEKLFEDAREQLAPRLEEASYLKGSEVTVSKDTLNIDEPAELTATIRVQENHHIQHRDPGNDALIASRLMLESINGIEFVDEDKQVWPEPHVRDVEYIGKVREQSGTFKIRVPFRITDPKFPSGPVTLRVLFRYQCCTDAGQCYPPVIAESIVRFVADTPNPPAAVAGVDEAGQAASDGSSGTTASSGSASPAATALPTAQSHNLLLILLLGFVGGLILNVMPCVLPVISIKILSFVQQAGEDPRRVFRLGLAFCAGIMAWFWLFAAASALGNVPLQSPVVVLTVGTIMFVFALNLFGVFEIVLPGTAAGKLDEAAAREGYLGSFFKGFLATLLGTACTAPFLVTALAYTATTPFVVDFLVFSAAGVGMASPYLLLTAKPGWLKYVPKPGPWMVTFKQAMGFVLIATAVWLLSILKGLLNAEGVVWTVSFWSFLALAVWLLGKSKPTWSGGARATTWVAAVAVCLLGWWFSFDVMSQWSELTAPETPVAKTRDPDEIADRVGRADWDDGIPWQPWWPGIGPELAAAGYTVYIDYTADWCLTCQTNKKVVLETDAVRARMRELRVIPVKADYTRTNPQMADELKQNGSTNVPLNLVYPAGAPDAVIRLPTLLNRDVVMTALDKAGPSTQGRAVTRVRP